MFNSLLVYNRFCDCFKNFVLKCPYVENLVESKTDERKRNQIYVWIIQRNSVDVKYKIAIDLICWIATLNESSVWLIYTKMTSYLGDKLTGLYRV